ncbi:MAG: GEVED domain-containing protein [Mariniphaga sp.]
MKRLYFILLLMIVSLNLISQPWIKNLPQGVAKGQLNLSHFKNAFNQYWAPFNVDKGSYMVNGVKTKAQGWKQFKRWEHYMENQINPTTGEFPKQSAIQVYQNYLKANPPKKAASLTNPSNWLSLGPVGSTGGYAGVGRINCIAFHPTDNNTWWVGAAAGGLWVTTNNGTSWTCLTDNNGVLAVSDIIIPTDFATSNTIYIATGDRDHWDNNSIGVLKSTDGGASWNTTEISYLISDGLMVKRLLVDPGNNQTLIAATSKGVFKTVDGGNTWNSQLTAVDFIDMEYKPGDFNTLYGSTTSGGIYVSGNGGASWTQSFTDANAFRISLAVSVNQPTWVYAIAANSGSGLNGIYKSTNSGASFTQVAGSAKNLLGWAAAGNDSGGQGWYDLSIAASPTNANTLLVGGVNTWRSTDGGVNWSIVNHWSGSTVQAVHADKHMLQYRADGSLFECNDGGVYLSANNGTLWSDKTNGIVISQMYKLGVSQTTTNETVTGLQDNGTKLLSGGAWNDVKGGDGMECLIDYTNANIQYGTYVDGQIDRTTDHWNSATDISANIPGGFGATGAWVSPYLIDPSNPQILYVGYSDIWKTTDRGNTWTKISSMNTANKIQSMAISASNTQVLYVADPSVLWKTTDNGTSWTNITGSLPTGLGNITYLAVKNDDENTLWVTLSGYSSSKVFQSVNGGTTWTDISAGLPSIPAYTIVQNKQSATEIQLYVGTEVGIYFKKGSDNWIPYNTGLPNVSVGEIEIYYATNPIDSKLRAATFGRGLWESPVYYSSSPMTLVSSTTTQDNTSNIAQNQINQGIIGIQIVTNGNLTPLSATSFTFNTSGSTNPATDITNAKVFYTGTSNVLATTTPFGSASIAPNGVFTVAGNQTLSTGINYFWLTYDVPLSALFGDVLDAQCTSLTVGTDNIPSVTNPPGSRMIGAVNYCAAGSTATTYEYISNVTSGSINQASGRGTNSYEDYTAQNTTMQIGQNYSATINVTSAYSTDQILIWIDWNKNGDFTDPGENVYVSSGTFSTPHTTATFSPPAGASTGTTRMRIRLQDAGTSGTNATPCGNSSWGEVEDYSVTVTAACTPPAAPSGITPQTFCTISSPTVAGLAATGTSVKWYAVSSGGTALATTTALVNGTHYFASQTISGCESTARLDVTASVTTTAAPTGSASQAFCAGNSPTVASLAATGTTIKWYAAATGGNALATTTALVNGTHYYASQTLNSCESTTRFNVTATVSATPATPVVGTITQPTCALATGNVVLNSLPASGTWTLTRSSGAITTTGTGTSKTITGLTPGTYTFTVKNSSGCVSASSANVVINTQPLAPAAPTGTSAQSFCSGATVASLTATGTSIKWYSAASGGTALATTTALVSGTHYYASQTVNTCESSSRFNVTATVNALPAAPAAIGGTKSVCVGKTTTLTDATTGGVWSSGTTSIATIGTSGILTGVAAGTVTISYTVKNASGCTRSITTTVTVIHVAAQPGNFTTSTSAVTPGSTSYTYTVPLVSGVTYTWKFSGTGATITGTTNSVKIVYATTATLGTLSVTATNSCGTSIARTLAITGLKSATIPSASIQGNTETAVVLEPVPVKNELMVYPNPTSGQVKFEFRIREDANAKLDLFTLNGKHLERIFDGDLKAGISQSVLFDQSLPSGIYPCVLTWKGEMITVKLIVVQ